MAMASHPGTSCGISCRIEAKLPPLPAPATCADGNGLISRDELLQTLSKQGVTVQGIDDIIAEVDKDGNGHIDYYEVRWRRAA